MAKDIRVRIVGDPSSLSRAFRSASSSAGRFGRTLGTVAKGAAFAAGAAGIGGIALTLRQGIKEFTEASKVAAQTEAVIKSTGGAANVTAKDVDTLAEALMRKSGVDDEVIKSSENLLLGFTNIRNEVGKSNDIFNQATEAVLNYSVRTGKDASTAAILFGKALNDPIKGLSQLGRVGIQFTESQKDQIKAMVEAGDTMGAQKLILDELEKRYGGAAEAAGKTLPGQLNILKETFNNLAGEIVAQMIPALRSILEWVNTNWATIETVFRATFTALGEAVRVGEAAVGWFVGQVQTHRQTIETAFQGISAAAQTSFQAVAQAANTYWPQAQAASARLVAWYEGTLRPAIDNVVTAITAIWARFGQQIQTILSAALTSVTALIRNQFTVITSIWGAGLALIAGEWGQAWENIKRIVTSVLSTITITLRAQVTIFGTIAKAIGAGIVDGIEAGLRGLFGMVTAKLGQVKSAIMDAAKGAVSAAVSLGMGIVSGIVAGLAGLFGAVYGAIKGAITGAIGAARARMGSTAEEYAARMLGEPLAAGIVAGVTNKLRAELEPNLRGVIRAAVGKVATEPGAVAAGRELGGILKTGIDEHLEEKLPNNLAGIINKVTGQIVGGGGAHLGLPASDPRLFFPPPPGPFTPSGGGGSAGGGSGGAGDVYLDGQKVGMWMHRWDRSNADRGNPRFAT